MSNGHNSDQIMLSMFVGADVRPVCSDLHSLLTPLHLKVVASTGVQLYVMHAYTPKVRLSASVP